jgi:hypothetical protein
MAKLYQECPKYSKKVNNIKEFSTYATFKSILQQLKIQ